MKTFDPDMRVIVGAIAFIGVIFIISVLQSIPDQAIKVEPVRQVIEHPYIENSIISPNCNGKSLFIKINKTGTYRTYTYDARCDV